jgi:hypothetical protein
MMATRLYSARASTVQFGQNSGNRGKDGRRRHITCSSPETLTAPTSPRLAFRAKSAADVSRFGGWHVRQSYSVEAAFARVPLAEPNLTHSRAHPLTCADVWAPRRVGAAARLRQAVPVRPTKIATVGLQGSQAIGLRTQNAVSTE